MRRRNLNRMVVVALMTTALGALAAEDSPPPPPPPPPPLEESGPTTVESPSSGEWSVKGQDGLLDKSTGHVRQPMLSFFLGFPFGTGYGYSGYYGVFNFGLGARFYIPIVQEGFLPMLNDSFGIEFGADTIFVFGGFGYGLGFALGIPVEARWSFHIFPKLEAYAKLGIGLGLFFWSGVTPYPIFVANVGVLFRLNKTFYLRAELGSPAVKVGIGIAF